jgi:hypothetical protein
MCSFLHGYQASKAGKGGSNVILAFNAKNTNYKERREEKDICFSPFVFKKSGCLHNSADPSMVSLANEV